MVNRPPAVLFQTALFVNVSESPTGIAAVPLLSTTRPSSFEKNPPPSEAVPFTTVWPVPDIVPPDDHDHAPATVRSPDPFTVPPVWVRFWTDAGALRVSVPREDTLTVPVAVAGPFRVTVPPDTVTAPVAVVGPPTTRAPPVVVRSVTAAGPVTVRVPTAMLSGRELVRLLTVVVPSK